MNEKLVYLSVISCFVGLCSSINILILEEIGSPSHHVWFRVVTQALAAKGYNVTVLSPDPDVSTTNIHHIHMDKVYEMIYNNDPSVELNFIELGEQSVFTFLFEFSKYSKDMCLGHIISDGWKQLDNYPNDFKFDLIIHDYLMGGCLISFVNKFENVPLVGMTAFNDNYRFSSYVESSLVPSLSPYPFYNHNPKTFIDRTYNLLMHIVDRIIFYYDTIPGMTKMIKERTSFKNTPSTLELARRSIVYMTNYDPTIDGFQQLPANVIPVGGLQIKAPSPLPEDLQSVVDSATNGLILFSLGTNVQGEMLGEERIVIILEAFRKLSKYTFLWKLNFEQLSVPIPSNVVIRKWVPQNDILAHKNTVLFITHAGLLSTQESIYHGIPMLGVPIFGDQFMNVRRSVEKGIADVLYIKNLSTENLYNKLNALLTQTTYKEQIKITSAAYRDQKETPLERALWWIDWVMRNSDSNHFQRSKDSLNFFQLESFDVIVFLAVPAFLSVCGCFWFVKLKCVFGDRKSISSKIKTN